MKIPVLEVQGYEADDVIGTLATQAGKQGINTYMLTPDKDYGQLVSDNVMMYRPRFGNNGYDVMGPEEVKAKFGNDFLSSLFSHTRATRNIVRGITHEPQQVDNLEWGSDAEFCFHLFGPHHIISVVTKSGSIYLHIVIY